MSFDTASLKLSRAANVITAICAIIIVISIMVMWVAIGSTVMVMGAAIGSTVESMNQSFTEIDSIFNPLESTSTLADVATYARGVLPPS